MMKILLKLFSFLFMFTAWITVQAQPDTWGQENAWESLNPGGGGQIQDLYFDRNVEGRIWFSSDMEGIYRSDDYGQSWQYVSRDLSHGMSFTVEQEIGGSRMYQGGLYGASYTDNAGAANYHEVTWNMIDITRGDAIASIAVSRDYNTVILAPGWQNKDPQKGQAAICDPVQNISSGKFNGVREIYLSQDAGVNWKKVVYEPTEGYRHVFGVEIHPVTDYIYLSAASGVYISKDNGETFTKVAKPTDALDGAGEAANVNKRPDGGSRGIELSPDGRHAYATYQTVANDNYADKRWAVYYAKVEENGDLGEWVKIMDGLIDTAEWFNPKVDPKSPINQNKMLIGTVWNDNANRVGLWECTLNFNDNHELVDYAWEKIIEKPTAGSNGNCFTFDVGWESRAFIVRAYDYSPSTWQDPYVISMGGMNVFLGDPSNNGFPCSAGSWWEVYGEIVPSAGSHTMAHTRGFASPYAYDVFSYKNYMIQGNADHGMLQSIDHGYSWTSHENPQGVTNVMSVLVTETTPELVLIDARKGFGAPSQTAGGLYAKELDLTSIGEKEDWKLIGGFEPNNNGVVQGLPSRNFRVIVADPNHPERVYVSMRGSSTNSGGIYMANNIVNVYNGTEDWVKISSADYDELDIRDVWVDPNNSDIVFGRSDTNNADGIIFRGVRQADMSYVWTSSIGLSNSKDAYVWDRGDGTSWLVASTTIGGNTAVYINKNLSDDTWNTESNWVNAGFDVPTSLTLRPEKWVIPGKPIKMSGLAAYGDHVVINTSVDNHKRGLGSFIGELQQDGSIEWSDWTLGVANNTAIVHSVSNQSKIIMDNGEPYYYVATAGTGPWRRKLPKVDLSCDISVSESVLDFASTGGTKTVIITASGAYDVHVDKSFVEISKENDELTVTMPSNNTADIRTAIITIAGCENKIITVSQSGLTSGGHETFDYFPDISTSWGNGDYVGDGGITWTFVQAKNINTLDGRNIKLRKPGTNPTPSFEGVVSGGITTFSVDVKNNKDLGGLEIYLNDELQGEWQVDKNRKQIYLQNLTYEGDVKIRLVTTGQNTSTYGDINIDNIKWSGAALDKELKVVNGTGSGFYPQGREIEIVADDAPAGYVFKNWTGSTGYLEDANQASTKLVMPGRNIELTANYVESTTQSYTLTVNQGTGSGTYFEDAQIEVAANNLAGKRFVAWTGDTDYLVNPNSASTTLTMPAMNVEITATYADATTYTLTVNKGSGSGDYEAGTTVEISAELPMDGYVFDKWTGDTEHIADVNSTSTTVTMPSSTVSLTATYREADVETFALTIEKGTGSGVYEVGQVVNIKADAAETGFVFLKWTGDVEYLADAMTEETTVTMPEKAITITATYREDDLTSIGDHLKEEKLLIYPNPASVQITVEGLDQQADIIIVNAMGQVMKFNPSVENNNIQITELPKGIYFLKNGRRTSKFIIK
ncbi:T9SS type A sorting domain-containing protein [Flammeovirga yaeyamensis]|uniref:T9SS type A sorting domain-containing protein n=1 Tax=Flammeovirga yaeyamensis TaxID=367791 RepID=A0AAX1NFD7_9BACT|nr:T9SS type A sorting domain-containing protein [Flammeovirga yaeyamensis]MBB3697228.1 archaellum component FlaF (FlaF/FlaG flagellin family) [Flammeovirga yaeyamensis]NMF33887.1 T9SS type A sorting domain-containing protein [Flammeovirga yaeyamensis]QWG04853.1 T9SS type A sorting domain-containing protein [Flammeovirga yaeyamensis]